MLHQCKREEEALHVPSQKKADQKSDQQNTPLKKIEQTEGPEVAVIHLIQIDQENDQLRRDDPPQKNENLTTEIEISKDDQGLLHLNLVREHHPPLLLLTDDYHRINIMIYKLLINF